MTDEPKAPDELLIRDPEKETGPRWPDDLSPIVAVPADRGALIPNTQAPMGRQAALREPRRVAWLEPLGRWVWVNRAAAEAIRAAGGKDGEPFSINGQPRLWRETSEPPPRPQQINRVGVADLPNRAGRRARYSQARKGQRL